jgi:hypothetical protein
MRYVAFIIIAVLAASHFIRDDKDCRQEAERAKTTSRTALIALIALEHAAKMLDEGHDPVVTAGFLRYEISYLTQELEVN